MNKIWSIATKDTLIRFRDRNGILLMLVAPLALAAIMGAAFGGFGGDDPAPITDIPIVIVNQDRGDLGQTLVDILESADLAELLTPVEAKSSTNDLVSDRSFRQCQRNGRARLTGRRWRGPRRPWPCYPVWPESRP